MAIKLFLYSFLVEIIQANRLDTQSCGPMNWVASKLHEGITPENAVGFITYLWHHTDRENIVKALQTVSGRSNGDCEKMVANLVNLPGGIDIDAGIMRGMI